MRGLGTLINLITVAVGSIAGVTIGHRVSEQVRATVMQGLGLVTLAIAVVGLEPLFDADRGLRRAVILIGAVTLGALLGELLRLEDRLERVGEAIRRRAQRGGRPVDTQRNFVDGFVVASTVFCVGPLTVLGSVEDGLGISIRLLAIKSALDGVASLGFASVYGWGVAASMLTVLVVQGAFTALAVLIHPLLTAEVLAQLGAIGGVLIIGIGLRLLQIKDIRVVSLTPALVLGPLAAGFFDALT